MFYGGMGFAQAKNITSAEESKSAHHIEKTSTSNIYDEIVIKNFPIPNNQSNEDDYDKLVSMLSYDAEKKISDWITSKLFLGVVAIFILLAGAAWVSIKTIIKESVENSVKELVKTEIDRSNKFIDNTISSFDKKREQAIEIIEKVKFEIELAQETLKEFRKNEIEINEKLQFFQNDINKAKEALANFENDIEKKEDEISKIDLKLGEKYIDLELSSTDEIFRLEQKINALDRIINKMDKNGNAKNEIVDELIQDLKSAVKETKYNAVDLLSQFELDPSKRTEITNVFIEILKNKPDTTFGSLLLSGLGELGGNHETLSYLLELVQDVSNPCILAIIGSLGELSETGIEGPESESVVNQLLLILRNDLDSKPFDLDITASKIRGAIALAFSCYGKKAAIAENDVKKLSEDTESETRKNAAIALGKIGSKSAISVLQKLENDEYIEVRDAASKAIEEIQGRNE